LDRLTDEAFGQTDGQDDFQYNLTKKTLFAGGITIYSLP